MPDKERLLIGDALRVIRSKKEITQEELSRRTRLSISFLSRVENGRKGVSLMVAERVAEALGVPTSFLYLLADRSDQPIVQDLQKAVLQSLMGDPRKRKGKKCEFQSILS